MKKIVFICIFLVCGFSYLNALTTTWTGSASGDWHNPDNWDTGVIPDASTDVYVPNTGYYSPSVTSDASCNSLINQSGFTVSNGASLNIQNDYASNSDAALDVYGGSLNVGGDMGVYGTVNIEGDGTNDASVSCTNFNTSSASSTTIDDDSELSCTHLIGNGAVTESQGGTLECDDFAIANGGGFNQSGGSFLSRNGGTFDSGSTLNVSGNGSFQYQGDFNCNGVVTVDGGTLWAGGSSDPNFIGGVMSQVTVNSGYFSIGDFSTSGIVNIQGGGTYWSSAVNDGTLNLTGGEINCNNFHGSGTFDQAGGSVYVTETFTNESTGIFRQGPGGLWATKNVTNQGAFTQTGGNIDVSENIVNTGTIDQSGGNFTATQDFTNEPAGIFRPAPGGIWAVRGLTNRGVYLQSGGDVTVSQDMHNYGTVDQSGGSVTITNDFTNEPAGIFRPAGGLWAVRNMSNDGSFIQSDGTLTVNGDLTLGNLASTSQGGGTLDLNGDVTFNSSFINTGSTGEMVFSGSRSQGITGNWMSCVVPNFRVINSATVNFDDQTSFITKDVTVQGGTLNLGAGHLEESPAGTGTLLLDGGTLRVGGNNTLPGFGTYSMNATSKVEYNSTTTPQDIKALTYPTLELSGTSKTLNGNASVSQEIILNTILDIGNYDFTLLSGALLTHSSNCFFATTGSGYLKRNNISSGSFPVGASILDPNGLSFNNNETALASIGARVETGITPTHSNAGYCLPRTWDIIKEGTLYADFSFYWLQTQETQPFEQARVNSKIVVQLCHTPPSWQVISTPSGATGTGIIGDPYRVDIGPIAMVSAFALGDGDHTLPVQLSAFSAVYSNDGGLEFVQVSWTTATETDVLGYNVYQSITDEFDDAMKINTALIPGQGTTTVGHAYSYDDLDADIDLRNYYWIEQMDYSGLSELFGPAVFMPEDGGEPNNDIYSETIMLQQYPNPVENNMKIEYQIKGSVEEQDAVIYIYNMKGEFIDTVFGYNGAADIDLSRYATGVYFYRLQDTSLGETYKFVVIR